MCLPWPASKYIPILSWSLKMSKSEREVLVLLSLGKQASLIVKKVLMYTTTLFILKWYLVHNKQTSWTESMHWTREIMCAFFHFLRIQLSSTHTYLSNKHFITCFAHAFVKADRIHFCFVRNQKLQYTSGYFFQITAGFSQTICALWEIPWTMGCLWWKTVLLAFAKGMWCSA